MEDRDTRYTLREVIELDDTSIGGTKKSEKRGRGARSKVPVLVAVETPPKGCTHEALAKLASLSTPQVSLSIRKSKIGGESSRSVFFGELNETQKYKPQNTRTFRFKSLFFQFFLPRL
jgi:hypothetical protein